jgi:Na+/H+ antiporter NhaA
MAIFFFVIGLKVRCDFDMGELRDGRRAAAPLLAAAGGMLLPVAIYLAFTGGTDAARGWGSQPHADGRRRDRTGSVRRSPRAR